MNLLRELLEDLETLNMYTLEVFDRADRKIGETKVIAASEDEAERLAVQKLRGKRKEAVSAVVVDVVDIDTYELSAAA